MRNLRPPSEADGEALRPVLLANLLPLVGVLVFDWEPATLVLIYGLEVLLSMLLAGGKALFARRPPPDEREGVFTVSNAFLLEKRGSLDPVDRLPPVYLRNVPFAAAVAVATVGYGFFFAVVLLVVFEPSAELARPAVLASVGALFVGQLAETRRRYVRERRYERVSPYAVVETPARQVFVLVFVLLTLGLALESAPTAVLVLVVCAKLFVEWATVRAERADDDTNRFVDRFAGWFAGPEAASEDAAPVDTPSAPPSVRIRPARRPVVLEGVLLACWRTALYLPFATVVWGVAVILLVTAVDAVAVVWAGVAAYVLLVLAALASQFARYYLTYGTLEYQRRGDRLVAYDRLLEEPQWAAPVDRLRDATVVNDRFADRLFDTRTIRVTTGSNWNGTETDRRLGPVDDPDRLVDAFELSLGTTALDPLRRPLAVGAVTLAAALVLGGAVALVAPVASPETRFEALVLVPFLLYVPRVLWGMACPETE